MDRGERGGGEGGQAEGVEAVLVRPIVMFSFSQMGSRFSRHML